MEKAIGLGWHLAGGHGALSKVRKWKLCELRSKRQGGGKQESRAILPGFYRNV